MNNTLFHTEASEPIFSEIQPKDSQDTNNNLNLSPQNCVYCNDLINPERVAALMELNIQTKDFLCIKCAEDTVKKKKGIYENFSGGKMIICTGLGQERIDRSIN